MAFINSIQIVLSSYLQKSKLINAFPIRENMSQKYFIDDVNIENNKKLCHFKVFPPI